MAVAPLLEHDILGTRYWVLWLFEDFVELTEVTDTTYSVASWLGDNESQRRPVGNTTGLENTVSY